jgi:hypothetical protein
LKDEQKVTGRSFSKIVNEALKEHIGARRVWVQARLSDYEEELVLKLEALHAELVHPNPKRYPTWKACLEGEGLLTQQAIGYSIQKGWSVE